MTDSPDLLHTKYQWLYTSADQHNFLHYVAAVTEWDDYFFDMYDEQLVDSGDDGPDLPAETLPWTSACGLNVVFEAPGIFSRMGCPRCPKCCDAIGITQGKGCPINDKSCQLLPD